MSKSPLPRPLERSEARISEPRYGGTFTSDTAGPLSYVLPAELVQLTRDATEATAASPARASVSILKPSPDRMTPACVHFGTCGGCHYQHATYPAQLAYKEAILRDLFAQTGVPIPSEIHTHQATHWGYRNRIRLRVEDASDSTEDVQIRLGYSRPASHAFLPIRMCPIAAPLLTRAVEIITQLVSTDSLCRRWFSSVSELELFCTSDESQLQLSIFLRDAEPARGESAGFDGLCERLRPAIPELVGAGAMLDPELNRRTRRSQTHGRWQGASWGASGLSYEAAGHTFWVSRGAFFQVNRFLIGRLVSLVCSDTYGAFAWDLFAGVGLFTKTLASTFTRVVAVEGSEIAAADLISLRRAQPNIEALHASTLAFLRAQQFQRERPSFIVLDPPRAGLGPEAAAILSHIAAPHICYVSCDPTTLARDLAILTRTTYRIEAIHLIDLFPQTFHIEAVVHLRRR